MCIRQRVEQLLMFAIVITSISICIHSMPSYLSSESKGNFPLLTAIVPFSLSNFIFLLLSCCHNSDGVAAVKATASDMKKQLPDAEGTTSSRQVSHCYCIMNMCILATHSGIAGTSHVLVFLLISFYTFSFRVMRSIYAMSIRRRLVAIMDLQQLIM